MPSAPTPPTPPVRKASEAIAEQIRAQIATGQLQPGEMLPPEGALLEQYQVARPTMREALRILESDGLVTVERGTKGGARVCEPNIGFLGRRLGLHLQMRGTVLRDLVQMQAAIQPRAAALAARRRTDEDLSSLRRAVAAVAASDTVDEFLAALTLFVDSLLRASGNPAMTLFNELTQELQETSMRAWVEEIDAPAHFSHDFFAQEAEKYAALVDLIEKGDTDGAEDFWREYMEETGTVQRGQRAPVRIYGDPPRRRRRRAAG